MSMRTALTGLSASQTELSTIANNIANSATLLLAFFVVMYSISSLNEGKYRVMSASLVAAFKGEPMKNTPIALVTEDGLPSNDPINLQNPLASGGTPPTQAPVQAKQRTLAEISHDVANAMADLVIKDQVVIRKHEDWIEVEIKNDVLFPSGSANLTRQANGIVRELGGVLAGLDNPIYVEGHTDNVPISQEIFPSNWELSAARASAVIRLLASGGVAPNQMTALGFGEYRPTQPNDTAEGRASNRRVMLAILSRERAGQSLYSNAPAGGTGSGTGPANLAPTSQTPTRLELNRPPAMIPRGP
ncbi:MAG: OmpA family protein [Gammaproteobacteria bacterium]|jgi:chemotaxis protein MotB